MERIQISSITWRIMSLFGVLVVIWPPITYADFYARRLVTDETTIERIPHLVALSWSFLLIGILIYGFWSTNWRALYLVGPWVSALIVGHIVWAAATESASTAFVLSNLDGLVATIVFTIVTHQAIREVDPNTDQSSVS